MEAKMVGDEIRIEFHEVMVLPTKTTLRFVDITSLAGKPSACSSNFAASWKKTNQH